MRPGQPSLAAFFRLAGWLRYDKPDLLQTWLYHADLLGILAARVARIRVVVWNIRNSELELSQYRRLSGWVVRICSWLSGWPQAVICNSHAGRDFHARFGYRPSCWMVIPNGINTEVFKPDLEAYRSLRRELGLAPDTVLIGQVARYHPMKNQTGFLAAAGELLRTGGDAHFVMVGQDIGEENADLVEAVRQQGLTGRVHMLGRQEAMPRIEAALEILTSASFGEGFPNVVAEAMACGVPCVVTDVGDSALLVGGTGKIIPPRDTHAIVSAWRELIACGATGRRSLGESARQRVAESFSLDKTIAAYQALYEELIAHSPQRKRP
jgi:glycosyltransferase involved in cell wall biosynthesis